MYVCSLKENLAMFKGCILFINIIMSYEVFKRRSSIQFQHIYICAYLYIKFDTLKFFNIHQTLSIQNLPFIHMYLHV